MKRAHLAGGADRGPPSGGSRGTRFPVRRGLPADRATAGPLARDPVEGHPVRRGLRTPRAGRSDRRGRAGGAYPGHRTVAGAGGPVAAAGGGVVRLAGPRRTRRTPAGPPGSAQEGAGLVQGGTGRPQDAADGSVHGPLRAGVSAVAAGEQRGTRRCRPRRHRPQTQTPDRRHRGRRRGPGPRCDEPGRTARSRPGAVHPPRYCRPEPVPLPGHRRPRAGVGPREGRRPGPGPGAGRADPSGDRVHP